MTSVAVRPAEPTDIPWLIEQLRAFDAFFASTHSLMPSVEYASATLTGMIGTQPVFVAVGADGPVGFIAGLVHAHPYNPGLRVLSELFWWVTPEHRQGRAGLLLLNAFTAYGEANADWVVMTLEAESPVNPSSLTRRGFRAKETNYLLEVA